MAYNTTRAPRWSLPNRKGLALSAGPPPHGVPHMRALWRLLVAVGLFGLAPDRSPGQTGVVTPNENLVTDGIPPVPATIAETARRYSEFRSASSWDWHPTRREMIIGTRFGDAPQLHRVKFPGGARTQLTFFPDPVSGASYQPTTGRYIVFTKDVGGAEFFQKYRYDVATAEITLLTDGKSRNTGGAWSHGGERYAYMSTRRDGRDLDLWVMNPSDPATDHLVVQLEGGGYAPADWSPDDRRILLHQGVSVNESYLWLVDVATGQKTLLTPQQGTDSVAYGGAQFSRDGKGIYVTTDRGSEFQRLAYLDLATGQYRVLTGAIPWDVDEFALSADGRWIAFVTNEEGIGILHVIDAATGAERRVPKIPSGVVSGLRWRKGASELGFTHTSARSNPDAYSLDLTTGKLVRWTESETAGLNTAEFAEPELIHWTSVDGRSISGFLYKAPPPPLPRAAARDGEHPRRARGPVTPRLPRQDQLSRERARDRGDPPEHPRLDGLRQDVREARQRGAARGGVPGHRGAVRLDPRPSRPRCGSRAGDRRQLRRPHDPRDRDALQRPGLLLGGRRGHLEPRHVPEEHLGLPTGPAAGRVRGRA